MPLHTDIDALALGDLSFAGRHYLFLLEPGNGRFVGAARYEVHRRYFECTNLVSDGYGPTLFVLLMQKARRSGLAGVAPDLRYNTDEAKRMDARFFFDALPGVGHTRNADATHAEEYLNQIYCVDRELIAEAGARRNFDCSFRGQAAAESGPDEVAALAERLEAYLVKSELPYK
jgi:hypothetical protein